MKYEPIIGQRIEDACASLVEESRRSMRLVKMEFNGIILEANPACTSKEMVDQYHSLSATRQREYEASPEGIKAKRDREEAAKAQATAIKEFNSRPFPTFKIADGKQDEFEKWKEINKDPYSVATVKYACEWARLMEIQIREGKTVEECESECSHQADVEGISGAMFGMAKSCLRQLWAHGHELSAGSF